MNIYLATSNPNKRIELTAFIKNAGLDHVFVQSADAVGGMPDVHEDQPTFCGNAELKVKALLPQVPEGSYVLADDSGLEVDSLDGKPGVRSARFASEHATDVENNNYLLKLMQNVPVDLRGAQFICCIAIQKKSEDKCHFFQKACEGYIAYEMDGDEGFGYDSLFIPTDYKQTFAALGQATKDKISHRAKAWESLLGWIKEQV